MKNYLYFLIIIFTALSVNPSYAQEENESSDLLLWFDQQIGIANSGVFNGSAYVEKHVLINEKHKFFKDVKFLKGALHYNGQFYYDLQLKYNLHEDELLLKHTDLIGTPTLLLDKSKISTFQIDEHHFVNLNFQQKQARQVTGFYECLIKNDYFFFYIKHKKSISTKTNQSFRYYEFKSNNTYLLQIKNEYHSIEKYTDLIDLFPIYRQEIRKLHKDIQKKKKNEPEAYFRHILGGLSLIMNNQKRA